ncbi:MAG TPA: hypothetical protein VFJ16_20915 [Longimicrobium sp.]|nr:hypothetical protein [Longimicrobium sp.]
MPPRKILVIALAAAAVLCVAALFISHGKSGAWNPGLLIMSAVIAIVALGAALANRRG